MRSRLVGLAFGCLFALCTPAAWAEEIGVTLDRPDPFQPAHGEVVIEAVVTANEAIERVTFYVDGVVVGELRQPPWRLATHLGDEVDEHHFEVVAQGASGKTGSGSLTTPSLRIDDEVSIRLQQLYVTVSAGERRVLDLGREDFVVLDEKERQELVTFARGDVPFTAAVLVDSSVSMEGAKLRAALAGAKAFFHGMRPLDEGKLLVFSDRVLHDTPFTTFPDVLTAGLAQVRARGGTSLNDHLYLVLRQLEERQGRRVALLLSDGVDSHSVLSMNEVAEHARRGQALIYWLRLPYKDGGDPLDLPALTTSWKNTDDYRREVASLEKAVAESGGRILPLTSIDDIEAAFRGILDELRDQYVLGYYPAKSRGDGSWRRVRVRVRGAGLDVRSRGGYVDH